MSVALNTKHLSSFISEEEYAAIYPQVEAAHNQLEAKSGPGNDFLGWMYLPRDYDKKEFARIKEAAAKIREDSDVLVVAGIGGSYLGARAVIEAVKGQFFNIKGGKGATLLVTGESPLIIREVVPAKLTKLSGDPDFSYKLSFSVPRNLQSPAPGVIASVMKFNSTIPVQYVTKGKGKKKKKIPLLATTSCPASKQWKFRYTADYTTTFDGAIESSQTVDTLVTCK